MSIATRTQDSTHAPKSGQKTFLATLSGRFPGNWQICKDEQLWGVRQSGMNFTGAYHGRRVERGDRIYVWQGKIPRIGKGILAEFEATGPWIENGPGVHIPWPDPDSYAGVFPFLLINELPAPADDHFVNRVSERFGIENIALQHGFSELIPDVAERIEDVL